MTDGVDQMMPIFIVDLYDDDDDDDDSDDDYIVDIMVPPASKMPVQDQECIRTVHVRCRRCARLRKLAWRISLPPTPPTRRRPEGGNPIMWSHSR
jgi:hypothetical protein